MKVFETEQEKKSLFITTISFVLLFLLFFYLKFSNNLPLPELDGGGGGGELAVNFGNSDFGSGANFQSKKNVTVVLKKVAVTPIIEKEILVSENEEAPTIIEVKKPVTKIVKPKVEKSIVKPVPTPSKSTSDAVSNIINGLNKEGDGDDKIAGNRGKSSGNPNSKGYNGVGGVGTGSGGGNGSGQGLGTGSGYGNGNGSGTGNGNGNWKLSGRKLSSSNKQIQQCNEYGTVVVEIKVNRNGDVIAAKYTKGTTNTSQCLISPAYDTARSYKWQPDSNAPETQTGYITVNFKLGQ